MTNLYNISKLHCRVNQLAKTLHAPKIKKNQCMFWIEVVILKIMTNMPDLRIPQTVFAIIWALPEVLILISSGNQCSHYILITKTTKNVYEAPKKLLPQSKKCVILWIFPLYLSSRVHIWSLVLGCWRKTNLHIWIEIVYSQDSSMSIRGSFSQPVGFSMTSSTTSK